MIEKREVHYTTTELYCTICEKTISNPYVCGSCGVQLCDKCDNNLFIRGRNLAHYCDKCWASGEKYRIQIAELDGKVKALYEEWRNEK